jgi:hypothetical protein
MNVATATLTVANGIATSLSLDKPHVGMTPSNSDDPLGAPDGGLSSSRPLMNHHSAAHAAHRSTTPTLWGPRQRTMRNGKRT